MCGIAGFFDGLSIMSIGDLSTITDQLYHRGPDSSGLFFREIEEFGNLGLGHRRLSILDLSESGNQPMEYDGLSLVFNGEIYNFREIRLQLELEGYSFMSNTDTEVVLKAFHHWGLNCAQHFIGMFAFAIFDSTKNKLYLCRDRFGVKPLFYLEDGRSIIFASELKSIVRVRGSKLNLSHTSLRSYFQYGYVIGPSTIYQEVKKMTPGSWLEYDLGCKTMSITSYWSTEQVFKKGHTWNGSFQDAVNFGELLIKHACEYRLVSDVPVGVFLSGGYDSSLVAAILQRDRRERLNTFTIGFDEKGFDESVYAKQIARYIGTEHHDYRLSQRDVLDLVPGMANYFDEPLADSSIFATFALSKFARSHVKVALSADGGDEFFGGYNKYDSYFQFKRIVDRISPQLLTGINHICQILYRYNLNERLISSTKLSKLNDLVFSTCPEEILSVFSSIFSNQELDSLILNKGNENVLNMKCITEISELSKILNYDINSYLRDDVLVKVDRCTMAYGLEGREPLLDHRVFEWAASLPDDFKYNINKGKKIVIKEIVHRYLPKEIMERPKSGFGIPIESWLRRNLSSLIDEFLCESEIRRQAILNYNFIFELRKRYEKGDDRVYMQLWTILIFQIWSSKWNIHE